MGKNYYQDPDQLLSMFKSMYQNLSDFFLRITTSDTYLLVLFEGFKFFTSIVQTFFSKIVPKI